MDIFKTNSLSRQVEACKDKMCADKTPRSVGQAWISANFNFMS